MRLSDQLERGDGKNEERVQREELMTKNQGSKNEAGGVRRQEKAWRKVVQRVQGDRLCQ